MPDEIQINGVDRLPITATREKTAEGYLKATAVITAVGVQIYNARDFGENEDREVGVFRPHDTVFHSDTMDSARLKPITEQHPDVDVTAKNYKNLSIGNMGEKIEALDAKRLGATVIVNDAEAVDKVERGLVETSAGYDATLVKESGSFEGRDYEYRFKGPMLINHLAVVDAGRCGPTVKILDKKGKSKMNEEEMKKFLIDAGVLDKDGKAVAVVDGKDEKKVDSDAMVSKMVDALKAFDAEKEAKKAKDEADNLENLKKAKKKKKGEDEETEDEKKAKKDAADKAVRDAAQARSTLIVDAKPHLGEDVKVHELSDREILEEALKDSVEDIKDKDDAYLRGMLDAINKDRKDAGASYPLNGKHADAKLDEEISKPMGFMDVRKIKSN